MPTPRASWLRHIDKPTAADHERFGQAMAKCQNVSGDCSVHGCCLRDGECFVTPLQRRGRAGLLIDRIKASLVASQAAVARCERLAATLGSPAMPRPPARVPAPSITLRRR